jgi:glycerophosphoryl diester phosphodiesterase
LIDREFPRTAYPLVVAHRGASARFPENTLESFRGALDAGAHAVELDVRLTRDNVPVVLHDADLSRTTSGNGLVHELSLSEVKSFDASGGRGERTEVPTLGEVLRLVSGRAGVNLEIKNIPGEPSYDSPKEAALLAAINELEVSAFVGPVLVSSFNPPSIERSRALDPSIPTGFLSPAPVDAEAALDFAREHGHTFVLPAAPAVFAAGPSFVVSAHGAGVLVGTWTVDDPDSIGTLFAWGVDAVATNDPEAAMAVRARDR